MQQYFLADNFFGFNEIIENFCPLKLLVATENNEPPSLFSHRISRSTLITMKN
jgi:hypothetical protein